MRTYTNPGSEQWDAISCRPVLSTHGLDRLIAAIFTKVENENDEALIALTRKFDGVKLKTLVLSKYRVRRLADQVPAKLRKAIDVAFNNIQAFHVAQIPDLEKETVRIASGVLCWRENRPIERVGLYVPGGNAPLVSTVLMLGVPAQIAGCNELVICTPPQKNGNVTPAICYAALKVGATKLITLGGAQAIAAMSVGTKTVPKVDKIFGPGNQYVTAAKHYAVKYGVATDMPAGPSEVLVLADKTASPQFVAADLLSQAEHGADSQVVLVSTDEEVLKLVKQELTMQLKTMPRSAIAKAALAHSFAVYFDDMPTALRFVNTYAPEHLILNIKNPNGAIAAVKNAGSVFLGNYSPESAGDYASGTNHTLPTNGWSKSYGGVSLDSFVKKITFQSLSRSGLKSLAPTIVELAESEGLSAHAEAVRIRLK